MFRIIHHSITISDCAILLSILIDCTG